MSLKHPKGLWILSFSEILDRFCYYGIVTVMTLYLAKVFLFSDEHIYAISGVYSTLGFGLPVIGGFVADRVFGYRKAIILGGLFLIFGNIILCFSGLNFAYLGLALVVTGIGLLKANVASQVGTLYSAGDDRKEGAFATFYFGMNIGALSGPIVFGSAVALFGWHAGFIFGAVGMSISLIWYASHYRYFKEFLVHEKSGNFLYQILCVLLILIAILGITWMFAHPQYFSDFVWVFACLMILILTFISIRRTKKERRHILAFVLFVIFSIFYFSCARQVNTSIELFLDRGINKHIFGFNVPSEWFASFEPIFILISLLVIAPFWRYLGQKNKHPSPHVLVIIGLFFAALSFVLFAFSAMAAGSFNINSAWNFPLYFLLLGYFVLGLGEMAIFPSITSMVTDLAPAKLQATFMGFWLLSSAFSSYVGALMADLSVINPMGNTIPSRIMIDFAYEQAFFEIAAIVFTVMLVALLAFPWIRRLVRP